MKPQLIIVLMVAIGVGIGLGQLVKRPGSQVPASTVSATSPDPSAPTPSPTLPGSSELPDAQTFEQVPLREGSPAFGPRNAKVTIVQWSDFQCPYCSLAAPVIREIREAYPNDVRFEFRHQPLPNHDRAIPAGIAAMAAHAQGKFWEYHDLLLEHQRALTDADLEVYAQQVGLDVARFGRDLEDSAHEDFILVDAAEGRRLGVRGTPTFFINGRKLMGNKSMEEFRLHIDAEIARADTLLAQGTAPSDLYQALLDTPPQPALDVGDAPTLGPDDAPVTVFEWSDFECPFCARGAERLKAIRARYGDRVRIVFKHQPLPRHRHAQLVAEASMAAHAQGRFWAFHDLAFAHQQDLSRRTIERFAEQLGLDLKTFREDLDSGRYTAHVRGDMLQGLAVGARSTPTFFINGRQLRGAQPVEVFFQVIDEELARATAGQAQTGP